MAMAKLGHSTRQVHFFQLEEMGNNYTKQIFKRCNIFKKQKELKLPICFRSLLQQVMSCIIL